MNNLNPFNPNSVVGSNLFAGRTKLINEICKKMEQIKHSMPSSFFIYGERGIGKTALAKLIRYIAIVNDPTFHHLNFITSYYSVESGQELNSVLQESLNKLTDEMDVNLLNKIGAKLGKVFQNGKFQIGAFGATVGLEVAQNDKTKQITIKDQTVSILSNTIKSLNEEGVKDGILIIIDELHNLKHLETAASIFRNIITTLDVEGLGKISFLLIGYEEDVTKFFLQDTSARRTFDMYPLDVMPDNEAEEVLTKGFTTAGVKWDSLSLARNISIAGGYPHSIQIIGHNLINKDQDKFVDQSDWASAIVDSAFDLQSKSFSSMYSFGKTITTEKDKILIALANQNKTLSRKEIAQITGNKNVYQYIPLLKESGAIKENDKKGIFLQSQLLRTSILIDQRIRKLLQENQALKQRMKEELGS